MKLLFLFISIILAISGFFYTSVFVAILTISFTIIGRGGHLNRNNLDLVFIYLIFFFSGFVFMLDGLFMDVARDIVLLSKNLIYLLLGFWIIGSRNERNLRKLINIVIIFSVFDMLLYALRFLLFIAENKYSVGSIRDNVGHGSVLPLYGLFCLIMYRPIKFKPILRSKFFFAIFVSLFLFYLFATASRTLILSSIILVLVCKDWLWARGYKPFITMCIPFMVVFVFLSADSNDSAKVLSERTLLDKMANSLVEMVPSDFDSDILIHKNWRAYESFRAMLAFYSASTPEKVLGQGYGTLIDVDFKKRISGTNANTITEIPWMHNGYLFVLNKNGIFGLIALIAFFAAFYLRLLKYRSLAMSGFSYDRNFCQLGLFSLLQIVFTTFIDGGLINKWDSSINFFFLGISLFYLSGRNFSASVNNTPINRNVRFR